MMVLVSYDVSTQTIEGRRRLRHIAKICQNHGQRVQLSVFECLVDPARWVTFRKKLVDEISTEKDSLRFYFLGAKWGRRVEHIGAKEVSDPEGVLIV